MVFKHLPWLLVAPLMAHAADSLVINGSMNFSGAGPPTGWAVLVPGGESWHSFENHPSPEGGAYFGIQDLDAFSPRFNAGGITQLVSGLEVGTSYQLSFFSMSNHTSLSPGAMQRWAVTFGTQTKAGQQTSASDATWVQSTMTFTATATVQALTFAAEFLPGSYPEILNLDGVTLSAAAVPEVSIQHLLAAGLAGLGWLKLRRRRATP
ncbi:MULTISPECIES: hypothetical protein [Roseateles]|uniref:DUF642 domain-containing protein n=1 Tax=Pelomonas aquatica TaxID=431058 RepID=A0ABU1ZE64_9BURK|nr:MULTISPECIES: hypothetical protein [Roseateles]KQY85520.1 hypothetical protein ASD35_23195 [Pelomonas sp. Root1444]MDR7298909.1 hypothetical protein [Pelomonas aquatica]